MARTDLGDVYLSADHLERIAFDHGVEITMCADRAWLDFNGVRYYTALKSPATPIHDAIMFDAIVGAESWSA